MVLYPAWIKTAQQEIDQVVGRNRLPGFADRPGLLYLEAVICELHRWASAAPLAFYHATSKEDSYREFTIPKETTIVPNTYAVHHSAQHFPEPSKFIPERWLPPTDARHRRPPGEPPVHFAFGLGRRECPGKYVANASLFIAISRILWAFDVRLGEHPIPTDETGM
jgi:cytochrome P450